MSAVIDTLEEMSETRSVEALRFEHRFVRELPGDPLETNTLRQVHRACYSRVFPTPVARPTLLALVPEVAQLLNLTPTETPELVDVLAGNCVLPGMQPYAACYGGHQFGNWAGQLGDGRAITLAEVVNGADESWEIQLKGAGQTPYSRRADGRAVLRSSLRELVCSEAMFHLGVPTTRALALVSTGEGVERDLLYDGHPQMEPGAIVCRVARSFLRFGNYEIHAARGDHDTLQRLVRFTIERHFPQFQADGPLDVAGFLKEVCERTAVMIAHWMRVGFVHGVMNTDNMSILGLTIDYGPYGWLEDFDPDWTPNITDAGGRRYRFGNQPDVAFWNLVQLARALSPLVDDVSALERALSAYGVTFEAEYNRMMLAKLGLHEREAPHMDAVLGPLFDVFAQAEIDMTLFFRALADVGSMSTDEATAHLRLAFYAEAPTGAVAALGKWLDDYRALAPMDQDNERRSAMMNGVNPLYVPRNYLVQLAIEGAESGSTATLHELLDTLRQPYVAQPGRERFAEKRPEWARSKPGCSMLSCSS